MFIIPNARLRSRTAPEAPKTISLGGKSRAELRVYGERMGFQDRELSAKDVTALTSEEYLWFETFFPNRLQEAEQGAANKKASDDNIAAWKTRKMWEEGTPEEIDAALVEVNRFVAAHPQFIGSNEANRQAIVNWLVEMNLPCTYANLVNAFQDLAKDGKLTLLDGDTELSGENLVRSPRLRVLLEAKSRPLPANESADAYLASHPELRANPISSLMKREIAQRQITAEFFKKSTEATATHNGTTFTDYE